jgi:SnoaL-like domain
MDTVDRLIAVQEITELVTRYNRAVDDRRVSAIADLFSDTGTLETMGRVISGGDALRDMFSQSGTEPLERPLTAHHVSNLLIEFDEDCEAHAESDFVVLRCTAEGVQPLVVGRYHDRLKKSEGRWHFEHRKTVPMARTDV